MNNVWLGIERVLTVVSSLFVVMSMAYRVCPIPSFLLASMTALPHQPILWRLIAKLLWLKNFLENCSWFAACLCNWECLLIRGMTEIAQKCWKYGSSLCIQRPLCSIPRWLPTIRLFDFLLACSLFHFWFRVLLSMCFCPVVLGDLECVVGSTEGKSFGELVINNCGKYYYSST